MRQAYIYYRISNDEAFNECYWQCRIYDPETREFREYGGKMKNTGIKTHWAHMKVMINASIIAKSFGFTEFHIAQRCKTSEDALRGVAGRNHMREVRQLMGMGNMKVGEMLVWRPGPEWEDELQRAASVMIAKNRALLKEDRRKRKKRQPEPDEFDVIE